jgi:hypothetical protein
MEVKMHVWGNLGNCVEKNKKGHAKKGGWGKENPQ